MHKDVIDISTPRIRLVFDPSRGAIAAVQGRFDPNSPFSANLLSERGISWQILGGTNEADITHHLSATTAADNEIMCTIEHWVFGVHTATSTWNIGALGDGVRVAMTLRFEVGADATAIVLDVSTKQWLLAGLFERGIVQQVCSGTSGFASTDRLQAFYTISNGVGSLAVVPSPGALQSILTRNEAAQTTGLRLVHAGKTATEDAWAEVDWTSRDAIAAGTTFESSLDLYANDLPFPTHALDPEAFSSLADAQTHFTAAYATSATTLGGYLITGSAYPTIAMPDRTYWSLHTFFDPDAWSTVGCLASSGDPYLEQEAKRVLDRALDGITESGQIPHHFDGERPIYVAISGAAQTGPNLFLCLAALDYTTATGDVEWFRGAWERGLRRAIEWVTEFYDPARQLLCVIGPLWVDVFRREGYTFDTNATAVYVLERMADAARYLDLPEVGAEFERVSAGIREGIEALWSEDHFVTARSADWEQIHDMVDSDGYLAPAFGLTVGQRSHDLLARLDRVPNMHPGGRGTWVSEVFYGPDHCYGGNTGDSATAMGRLWWADLLARQSVGDRATFAALYEAVRDDQRAYTWMRERYGAEGTMIRATGYHEYPEILDKMLREGYYGLTMTLQRVTINPMLEIPYSFSTGRVRLAHSAEHVELTVPGDGLRRFEIGGLTAMSSYSTPEGVATADAQGFVRFTAAAGTAHEVTRQ
ncbi:hypothetical protein BH11ACT4_BH11ACT4_16300 [soil metagenome]